MRYTIYIDRIFCRMFKSCVVCKQIKRVINMILSIQLNRITGKAVRKTLSALEGKSPEIYFHDFYGAVDVSPRNLVIWYIFKTDSDLSRAKDSGFCNEIENLTAGNLIACGYPESSFDADENGRKVSVCFASQEDVDRKADGDYRLYFQ